MRKILHTLLTSCKSAFLFFFSKMHFYTAITNIGFMIWKFQLHKSIFPHIFFFLLFVLWFSSFFQGFFVALDIQHCAEWPGMTKNIVIGPEMPDCVDLLWSISACMTYVLEWRPSVHILLDFLKSLNFQTHSKQNLGKTRPVFLIFLVMPYYHIDPLICKMLLLVVRYTCACFGTRFIMAKMTNNTSKLDLSVKNMTSFRTAE